MADNVAITAGSGTTIGTDDVSGVHIQKVKLVDGTADSAAVIPGDATYGLDVDVTRVTGTVAVSATDLDIRNLAQATDSVAIGDGTDTVAVTTAGADGESNTANRLEVEAHAMRFNGSTWDRARGTVDTCKCAQYTTTQTGTALWTPGSGKRIVLVALQIQAGGTTAGSVQVWFGGSADTTYTRGTDAAVFDGEFAPSATLKPGVYVTFPTPLVGTADYVLRVTDSAAINTLTVTVWGYEL